MAKEDTKPELSNKNNIRKNIASFGQVNRLAALSGFSLFVLSAALLIIPTDIRFNIVYLNLVSCIGIGLILYAVGDEARLVAPALNITGASAIGLTIFFVSQKAFTESEKTFQAETQILWQDVKLGSSVMKDASKPQPKAILIAMNTKRLKGSAEENANGTGYMAKYSLNAKEILDFLATPCPFIQVNFSDGNTQRIYFLNSKSIVPSDYDKYFSIKFYTDIQKVYAYRNSEQIELKACDSDTKQNAITAKTIAIAEAATGQNAAPPVPIETIASVAPTAPSPSSGSSVAPPMGQPQPNTMIGYVLFSRFNASRSRRDKSWFEIEGRPDAKFPLPGDTLRVTENEALLRAYPYRWDAHARRHLQPSAPLAALKYDQKVVVAGDTTISIDDNNGDRYAIVPIASAANVNIPINTEILPIDHAPSNILGYAYLGYIDPETGEFAEKYFSNNSKPDAVYPAPNDILTATSGVWLRSGPRRWDSTKRQYVSAAQVKAITQGQVIRVGGDVVLAKGGTSIWIPVSEISDTITQMVANVR